ncbi:MAG TPA: amidohydrolase [Gemmatimonadales bacterium]|jgi:predicted amidohydrolase YtcJ|nr:amidohydrolase [Gemmatimonadales bacterium]
MRRLSLLLLLPLSACAQRADLVITHGMVWTGTGSGGPVAGGVAIAGDKIVAVGDSAALAPLVGPGTRILDARGGLIAPGFNDAHTHFVDGGFQLSSVDLRTAATPQEFVRRVAAFAKTRRPGEWITGGDWDHTLWPGQPLPRREWIDSVTPDNPVYISRLDGHEALANTAALKAAKVTKDTPTPAGGEILHDARTGEPTGIFKDNALALIAQAVPEPSPERLDSAVARAQAYAESLGLTGTSFVSVPFADWASLRRMEQAGKLTMRFTLYLPLPEWRAVADSVKALGAGDDWVRVAGVKGFMDGSAGARTAKFYEPYSDSAGYTGLFRSPPDSMAKRIGAADSVGLQVAVHAIGDEANGVLLGIYDSVGKAHGPRDRRFRVEHAQHLRAQDIPMFGRDGIIASVQPSHLTDDGRWIEHRIGPERIKTTYPFRTLLDTHAVLAFGSDWDVATPDPLKGIDAAVTRRTNDGKNPNGWMPAEKITLTEALRAYTWGNAYAVHREKVRGTLAPGMYGDVVVVDRNLFAIPADSIGQAHVQVTVVGGKVVFERH